MPDLKDKKSRREFIQDGIRAIFLGGFVFSGLFLGWRGRANSDSGTTCVSNLTCRNCDQLHGCREPAALKEHKRESKSRSFK